MLLEEDTQPRAQVQAWSQERLQLLMWSRFLGKLEQGICTRGSQYRQVTKRMDHLLCRLPHLIGLQTSFSNCAVYYQGWVHGHVTSTMWRHYRYEHTTGNEGAELQGHIYWILLHPQGTYMFEKTMVGSVSLEHSTIKMVEMMYS